MTTESRDSFFSAKMAADLHIVDKEGALHSTKTMGHKMTSFFTGIKKEQSKGLIINICCSKSVISMSKSRPSAKRPVKKKKDTRS